MLANHEDEKHDAIPSPRTFWSANDLVERGFRRQEIAPSERWQKTRSFVKLFVQNGQF